MQEIDHPNGFAAWLQAATEDAPPIALQDVDLRGFSGDILGRAWPGSLFLGCHLEASVAGHVVTTGGVVIPDLNAFEFSVHRAHLYRVNELFDGFDPSRRDAFQQTWDYRVYRQYLDQGKDQPASIAVTLARRLHDHSITDAVRELLDGRRVAAVMGGHGMERRDPFYAQVARMSRRLTRDGFLMISGGGPGAMEACHLGAWFAPLADGDMETALDMLRPRPEGGKAGKEYADWDWLHRAMAVRERFPLNEDQLTDATSLGIPTWLYGHEPPAPFASHVAKYFANSVREDGLLALALDGVVFAPGSAGTTQEIFQDATQNHYGTAGYISPMILFGVHHWTQVRPVWPLLKQVAEDQHYGQLLSLTDDVDEVVRLLKAYRRQDHRP